MLQALDGRTASPSELAAELEVPLGVLSYHVRRLTALGFLRLVRRVPRRGAVEHYYTAVAPAKISGDAWARMPSAVRSSLLSGALAQVGGAVTAAAADGGFDAPGAQVISHRLTLDARGWDEAAAELDACARRLEAIAQASAERSGTGADVPGRPACATAAMLLFAGPGEALSPGAGRR